MLTQEQITNIVREVYAQFQNIFPICRCYLYGSYARGDHDEESDLDILITTSADEEIIRSHRKECSMIASRLSLAHDITISVTIKAENAFNQRAAYVPYYQNIIQEGHAYAG